MRRSRLGLARWAALVAGAVTLLAAAPGARADEDGAIREPSPAGLVVGAAAMAGGGALQYFATRHYADHADAGVGWLLLGSAGEIVMQVGALVEGSWGWQLGEFHFAVDAATGGPVRERHPVARAALGVAALAVISMYAGAVYLYVKNGTCTVESGLGAAARRCAAGAADDIAVVNLVAGGLLALAAPVAGHGLGYADAAENSSRGRIYLRYRVAPTFVAGAPGLGLVATF